MQTHRGRQHAIMNELVNIMTGEDFLYPPHSVFVLLTISLRSRCQCQCTVSIVFML
ncbi:hypothetical protein BDZ97DRAFT_1827309 [Flammula alnicola]|nr:hypothetical protein BDZ97DRAFT_1827309 [Flammula alnicola]